MEQIRSMTGYGRSLGVFPSGRFTVELQSENRRFLEINISLPRFLSQFEIDIRKEISTQVGRGKVNASISWQPSVKQRSYNVVPNLALAEQLKNAWEIIAKELAIASPVDLRLLAEHPDLISIVEVEDKAPFWEPIKQCLNQALAELTAMKQSEGQFLADDLEKRLNHLETLVDSIGSNTQDSSERYRKKLTQRLEDLFNTTPELDERILKEIAIFAERVDTTEEIVRFKSHCNQFHRLLKEPVKEASETRGKTFDFLIQEMQRELNTIGSKNPDVHISSWVVEAKSTLEKMREQVQNIE